jgi:AraC-like DNA-binding protein
MDKAMGRLINRTGSYDPKEWLAFAEASGFRAGNLAVELGVSQRQLERYVKRQFGSSPQRWLKELRMTKALMLIASMDSVKEVAYSLGFKQVSHFCREFKTFHGLTCGEYASCLSTARRRWGSSWQCVVWTRKGKLAALLGRSVSLADNGCRKSVMLHRC